MVVAVPEMVTACVASAGIGSVAYFHRNLEHSEFFANPVLSKTEMTNGAVPTVKWDMKITVRLNGEKK